MVNDLGQFATRIAIGLGIASHGTQKAFGWFDGPGPEGWAQFTESLGLKPGTTYGTIGAANELTAGALIALGLGGPLGPAILIAQMLVAAETVHRKNGFFVQQGGLEIPMLYAAAALGLASTGYGALSLDRAFGLHDKLRHPILTTLALGGAIAGACTVLAQRELPVTSEAPPESGLET